MRSTVNIPDEYGDYNIGTFSDRDYKIEIYGTQPE